MENASNGLLGWSLGYPRGSDTSPDGQRFLMLKPVESQASAPTQINVVLNWFEELRRKAPVTSGK